MCVVQAVRVHMKQQEKTNTAPSSLIEKQPQHLVSPRSLTGSAWTDGDKGTMYTADTVTGRCPIAD